MPGTSSANRLVIGPLLESLGLSACVMLAVVVLNAGAYLSWAQNEPHHMNRAGAGVVAIQVIGGVIEFMRRQRLRRLNLGTGHRPISSASGLLEQQVAEAEAQALIVVLFLAFVGEIFHGFGDLIFKIAVDGALS